MSHSKRVRVGADRLAAANGAALHARRWKALAKVLRLNAHYLRAQWTEHMTMSHLRLDSLKSLGWPNSLGHARRWKALAKRLRQGLLASWGERDDMAQRMFGENVYAYHRGRDAGAAIAFGLMGMAEAIRATHGHVTLKQRADDPDFYE